MMKSLKTMEEAIGMIWLIHWKPLMISFEIIDEIIGHHLMKALQTMDEFIVKDLGGQLLQLNDTRLMLLPPGCRGVNGVESEAFASDPSDFERR